MISQVFSHIIRFVLLVVFQILILNHIRLGGYINPFVYIYWVLLLPIEIPTYLLLLLAFLMGITIDVFSGSIGLHTFSLVLMAYARPFIIRSVTSKRDYEPGVNPRINDLGIQWFITYVTIMTFIHHLSFFVLEAWSFSEFWSIILRTFLSSLLTILVIVFTELTFSKGKKKNS